MTSSLRISQRRPALVSVLGALLTTATLAASPVNPGPVAPVRDVPSTFFGTPVHDPYRWMEDVKSPQTQTWLRAQGAATRAVLDRIGLRDTMEKRIAELSAASGDVVRSLTRLPGDNFFYLKRARNERQFKLMMRKGLDGDERLLVDPEVEAARTGVPHAINYFKPSWDSRYLAYGMSAGGSENASLYMLDTQTGKVIGKPVPRVHETPLHWLPDSRSITFSQLKTLAKGEPEADTYKDSRVLWWRVGTPSASAKPVFGPTVTRTLGLDRLDVAELVSQPGSAWLVARTTDTTVPEGKLFVAPLASLGRRDMGWKQISSASDKIIDVALKGDSLFMLSQDGAPRRRVLQLDLRQPVLARAVEVVAPPTGPTAGVIEGFDLVPGGIVTHLRQGTSIGLQRHAPGDKVGKAVSLPAAGAAYVTASPAQDSDDLIYSFSSWTELPRLYRLQGDKSVPVALVKAPTALATVPLQVTDVLVESHDGVKVPMTILNRQGMALDGRNPVLLNGYASYGFTTTAGFSPAQMAWIEQGGVVALLNPRGSGVYGDDWHRAGFKQTKRNTWLDGVAAAKYLIAKGYGSPATMGVMGTSAGGIFVGRVTTAAPELFAAAIYDVGMLDTVRSEESANGATNVSEFGTVKDPEEFKALLEMSTYNAIKDDTAYPAVMLVHGLNDPRVDVWQSGKTAARLQAASNSGRPVLLRLDLQAGHGMGSTATQRYAQQADIYSFLLWQMGKAPLKD